MSKSEYSTIPNTPEPGYGDDFKLDLDEIFAWLRPLNDTARQAFNETVNTVIKQSPEFEHVRPFLHCDVRQSRAPSVFTEDNDSYQDELPRPVYQWAGAFGLCLSHLPADPGQGWRIGSHRAQSTSKRIDLMLAPPTDYWLNKRIAGHHATLSLHTESCRVILNAKHSVTTGRGGAKTFREPESYVLEHSEIVLVGDCAYTFQYTDYLFSSAFDKDVTRYMREHHEASWCMNRHISPSSVGLPTRLGQYYCSPSAFAQGTFGSINAGWTEEGRTVAIKTFKAPNKSEIRSHIKLMEYIGQHENIVRLLNCVDHLDAAVPGAYCIYTPLAVVNLSEIIATYTPDASAKAALFTDYLRGLSYLHGEKNIMHRDISPGNLAVTSLQQPTGIIIDLDAATNGNTSTDHMKGTLPFLAPEIIRLKKWTRTGKQPPSFEKSIDTWALGLNMYALYVGQSFRWAQFAPTSSTADATVTLSAHQNFQNQLQKTIQKTEDLETRLFLDTITQMTAYDIEYRISATDALEDILSVRGIWPRGTIVPKAGLKRSRED